MMGGGGGRAWRLDELSFEGHAFLVFSYGSGPEGVFVKSSVGLPYNRQTSHR